MNRVFNFGSINVDNVYRVPHLVREGETLSCREFMQGAGGKGFNQSVALARAGAPVAHVGRYGTGAAWLVEKLAAEKVDVRGLTAVDLPAGQAIIQVTDAGQNAIVLLAGANHAVAPGDVASLLDGAEEGDWFLAQNETSCVPEALRAARARGLTVCFNPAPMTPAVKDFPLETVDWLFVNEVEGQDLTGETEPEAILAALRQRCPRAHLVLTLGAEGALVVAPDGETARARAPRVVPVDTTGAGDTFIGYLIAARFRGADLAAAADQACRAAALGVTKRGAADSIPFLHEIGT